MADLVTGTSAQITPFLFETHTVRVVMRDGEPWFVARDVCDALGYEHVPHAMRMLDDDEKGIHILDTLGGQQKASIVSESGLFTLVLRSRKPEARKFFKWVTGKVLPSIRKTGGYGPAPAAPARNRSPSHKGSQLPLPSVILEPARSMLDAAVWRITGQAHEQIADWAARRLANSCRVDVAADLQRRAEGVLNALTLDDFLTCGEVSRAAVLLSLADAVAATATEQAERLRKTLASLLPQAGQGVSVNPLNRDI